MKTIKYVIAFVVLLLISSCGNNDSDCQQRAEAEKRRADSLSNLATELGQKLEDYHTAQSEASKYKEQLEKTKAECIKLIEQGKTNSPEYEKLLNDLSLLVDSLSAVNPNYSQYKNNPEFQKLFKDITHDVKEFKVVGTALANERKLTEKLRAEIQGMITPIDTPEAQEILRQNGLLRQQIEALKKENQEQKRTIEEQQVVIDEQQEVIDEQQEEIDKYKEIDVAITNISIVKGKDKKVRVTLQVYWNSYEQNDIVLYLRIYPPEDGTYSKTMLTLRKDGDFQYSIKKELNGKKYTVITTSYSISDKRVSKGNYLAEIWWNGKRIASQESTLPKFLKE